MNDPTSTAVLAREWLCCSRYVLALEMVRKRLGVALLPGFMVQKYLNEGSARRLPGRPLPTGQIYNLCMPWNRRGDPALLAVANRLQREVDTMLS